MRTDARIEDEVMPPRSCEARDEMNLAEFPLCALAHRLQPEVKTLRFEDRIWDKGRKLFITRKLIITGSDAYGLPTEKDDEVLLGLIQLTRACRFIERKVPFTRHELIGILGWRDDSKSYARIEESLNRWTGVTLYYDNAWWNKDRKCWMNEKFHILDNVWLCHRGEPAPDTGLPTTGAPQSAFVWNEVVFRSFTHGNLKSIDFEFFKSLKSAVAKRLYRFLDKHFYKRNRFEMDLRELCCEHVGLSRNYDTAGLKRKLLAGVKELEEKGFLHPLSLEEQFIKVRRGEWQAVFSGRPQQSPKREGAQSQNQNPIVQELIQRGVHIKAAATLSLEFSEQHLRDKLLRHDSFLADPRNVKPRNAPGLLVSSIRENYTSTTQTLPNLRNGLSGSAPQAARQITIEGRGALQMEPDVHGKAIMAFWSAMGPTERQSAEANALERANDFQRKMMLRGGRLADTCRQCLLDAYAERLLNRVGKPSD